MRFIGDAAAVGMAIGPPLIYVDQARKIVKSKDSSGFSSDICAVVIIANIIRCFFFVGHPFERSLIIQSILLIISQLFLLALCVHYKPAAPSNGTSQDLGMAFAGNLRRRPFNFWRWEKLGSYLEFLAGMIVVLIGVFFLFKSNDTFVELLGIVALGLESTLPVPQLLSNFERKSTAGFSDLVLAGWLGGDLFKTGFYLARHSPMQFTTCGAITVFLDLCVLSQRIIYRNSQTEPLIHSEEARLEVYQDQAHDHEPEETGSDSEYEDGRSHEADVRLVRQ